MDSRNRNRFYDMSSDNGRVSDQNNLSSDFVVNFEADYEAIQLDDRMDIEDDQEVIKKHEAVQEKDFTYEKYNALQADNPCLHPQDFCKLTSSDKKKVIFKLENLDVTQDEWRELPEENKQELLARLKRGKEKRGVYTSELEQAVIASSQSLFPSIGSIKNKSTESHWTKWINSRKVYSLESKPANVLPSTFKLSQDADATIVHTDTLKVLKQCLNLSLTPQYSSWAMKIKHEYKGVTLHNVVNVQIGEVAGKWKVYVCFLDCPRSRFPEPKQLIDQFYLHLLQGIVESPQRGSMGIWHNQLLAFTKNKFHNKIQGVVEVGSFVCIENKLDHFTYNGQKIRLCFSFQYFGKKEIFESHAGFEAHMQHVASVFNLDDITDPNNHLFDNTQFIQDLAFTISPEADYRSIMSLVWSPQYLECFAIPSQSPLGNLMQLNERHPPTKDEAASKQPKGHFVLFPNLGLGQVSSCMIEWHSKQYAVREVKVYCSASQFWRNNAPYNDTCYTVGVVPFDIVCHGSNIPEDTQKFILNKSLQIGQSFLKSSEKANIDRILQTLKESSAGIRLEVSFQNLGVQRLLAAFDEMKEIADSIIETHLELYRLCCERKIPDESMRFSPVQLVSSESIKLLTQQQAITLHTMFEQIYKEALKEQDVLNIEVINALALLEDLQQLIWSGSIPTLHNPKLFSSLNIIENIFAYNKIYIPQGTFSFNWEKPASSYCDLPLLASNKKSIVNEDEDAQNILAPQLALTRRFLYQAFKWRVSQVGPLCESLEAAVQLQTTSKQELFQPLYPSKSMVLATSLLNSLFESFFAGWQISPSKHKQVFKLLTSKEPFTLQNIKCSKTKKVITRFIETCFPIIPEDGKGGFIPAPPIANQQFFRLWQTANASFPELNEKMHFAIYQDVDEKNGATFPMLDRIEAKDVHNQMNILLYVNHLEWVPVLGVSALLAKKDNFFFLDKVVPQFYSPFYSSPMEFREGQPLPHPVDNSFIFMMAKRVAKKIERERDAFVEQKKASTPRNEAKGPNNRPSPIMKPFKTRNDPDLIKYKAHEIIGHILYQYFHVPVQDDFPERNFPKTVHYGNVKKPVLIDTGMLVSRTTGKGMLTVSKDDIMVLYRRTPK